MTSTPNRRHVFGALVLDVALVTVFAASGRASHNTDILAGLFRTLWPFLVALLAGWLAARAWTAPTEPRTGVFIWVFTVAGGMLLRWTSDQGTQLTFIVVASLILLGFLVGWRILAARISARRS